VKRTLLQIVQRVLESIDSDEVNSVSDTVESTAVSHIVERCFYNIVDMAELKNQKTLFNMTASGSTSKPVLMTRPTNVKTIEWLEYNIETSTDTDQRFVRLTYLPLPDFLEMTNKLRESDTNVDVMTLTITGLGDVTFLYRNDYRPCYYTTFDDDNFVFDAYDSAVDSTLQSSKTRAFGETAFTFTHSDTFVPPLNDAQHTLLLNQSINTAWAELKQTQNAKGERDERRILVRQQKERRKTPAPSSEWDRLPDYGRKPR